MNEENLSIIVEEGHPSYEWAKKQSDSVNAFGHIGTHIDCYESEPEKSYYEVEAIVINCTDKMPSAKQVDSLDIPVIFENAFQFNKNIEI